MARSKRAHRTIITKRTSVVATVGVLALGILTRSETLAHAQSCGSFHPARYTNSSAGDVALTTAESALINGLVQNLGGYYGHAAVLYDNSGRVFTESTFYGSYPQSSQETGEPNACSRIISPYELQRLQPGNVVARDRDPRNGVLVKGGARAYCSVGADTYHINAIKNRHHGGFCAGMLEDDCGAAVTGPWQTSFSPTTHYNEAIYIYNYAYPLIDANCQAKPWYDFTACGGLHVDGYCQGLPSYPGSACPSCPDRGASQVVNEFATVSNGLQDGWTDRSVYGELLGEAKTNYQPGAWWYNNWNNFTPRVPDNMYQSAGPTGHAVWGTSIAAAYYDAPCPNGKSCVAGTCRCTYGQCAGSAQCCSANHSGCCRQNNPPYRSYCC
jgi:hypothetical protein